jgi:hypothetical protein
VFSAWSVPRCYKQGTRLEFSQGSVETGIEYLHVALRVVGGDEKGTHCLGVYLGHPVAGEYKYGDLALQVGRISNLRQ